MKPLTRVLVERLRSGVMSRNRHFRFFHRPEGTEALRVHHYLRSVERDLLRYSRTGEVRVQISRSHRTGPVTLRLEFPRLGARRTCTLSPAEYALLLSNPQVGPLLREG